MVQLQSYAVNTPVSTIVPRAVYEEGLAESSLPGVQEVEIDLSPRHHKSFCSIIRELSLHMSTLPHYCREADLL